MGGGTPRLEDYEIREVKQLQSSNGTKSTWVSVKYVKRNPTLTIQGTVSASS